MIGLGAWARSGAGLLGLFCLVVGPAAWAQSGGAPCATKGTQFTFSEGTNLEAVGAGSGAICRFRNVRTNLEFERLFGAFDPRSKLVKANLELFQSLAPLRVGQKVSFSNSGGSDRGQDGIWFYDVIVERSEQVQTPAGTFASFVILYDEQSPVTTKGLWQRRYWYAPQVGYAVKFEYQAIRGNPPQNYPKDWMLTGLKTVAAAR